MAGRHVQVIASGASVAPVAASSADVVICADGGFGIARAAGRRVDLVIGDLDSATRDDLAAARADGTRIEPHPTTKDESDLELAITSAVDGGATSITVHVADGGRLDHQLANLVVLASPRWQRVRVDAWVGHARVWVVHRQLVLPLGAGDPVAIQAVGGAATVTTTGLAYPLDAERLHATEARGIANEVRTAPAEVRVDDGVVLVISSTDQSAQAT